MKFSLDASGAQQMGRSIGKLFQAAAMGPALREQARMDTDRLLSTIYANNMAGNQRGAEALKTQEETTGLRLTNQARTAPIDASLPQYLQHAYRLFQATGDDNAERLANAGQTLQSMGMTDKAAENIDNLDLANRWNTLAKPGATYTPYDNVGTTGYSLNKATGAAIEANPVLARLFGDKNASEVAENRAQASSANAAAGKYGAEAEQTRMENTYFREKGAMPGRGAEGGEGSLSSTVIRTLDVPVLDAKGRPVRNPMTGEPEMQTDREALASFYRWADENGRKPTAAAFSRWEAQGRPGANKSPAPGQGAPTMPSKRGKYSSADEVGAAFAAGKITREEAKAILLKDFGMK